jgi:hypothetical protein
MRTGSLLLLFLCAAMGGLHETSAREIYFLHDQIERKWCGYSFLSDQQQRVAEIGARTAGMFVLENTHVSSVAISMVGESGDWMVFDQYRIGNGFQVISLEREITVWSEQVQSRERFRFRSGKAVLVQRSTKALVFGREASLPTWFKAPAVATTIREFEFWPLLKAHDAFAARKFVCVAAGGTPRGGG